MDQGHGNHWECVEELPNVFEKVLPSMAERGNNVETLEVTANCFDSQVPTRTLIYSITDESELTAKFLIAANREKQSNELVSGYPFIQSRNSVGLRITEITEWDNLIEAVITGKTESGHSISFFDTNYFLHKADYKIGETYEFSISALAYDVEVLKDNSFAFKGQEAKDWLAKIGREPTYDEMGNIEPVVFHLKELVAFLPFNEGCPSDVEFQSPINAVETIQGFDRDFYKINITICRDPDIYIDLYAKQDFFDNEPQIANAIRGLLWLQGHKS